jgi:pimeloyl-ACP methyl ester carboxylesterase
MAEAYVDLRGIRTWYGDSGEGPPLVMLHPGGVDSRALAPNAAALAEHFHVWLPERRGHGRTLATIRCRTLVMAGDDDEMPLEHTLELYRSLPDSELAIVPGTSYGFLVEKPDICNALLLDFLTRDPVPTFAPIRRA